MAKRTRNSTSDDEHFITLVSKDSETFSVDAVLAAEKSKLIRNLLDDNEECTTVPLLEVSTRCLEFIADYINEGEAEKMPTGDLLFEVVVAANYMDMPTLLDSSCKEVANMIQDKSVQEIRDLFGIKSTLTKEQEDAIKKENQWAFTD